MAKYHIMEISTVFFLSLLGRSFLTFPSYNQIMVETFTCERQFVVNSFIRLPKFCLVWSFRKINRSAGGSPIFFFLEEASSSTEPFNLIIKWSRAAKKKKKTIVFYGETVSLLDETSLLLTWIHDLNLQLFLLFLPWQDIMIFCEFGTWSQDPAGCSVLPLSCVCGEVRAYISQVLCLGLAETGCVGFSGRMAVGASGAQRGLLLLLWLKPSPAKLHTCCVCMC